MFHVARVSFLKEKIRYPRDFLPSLRKRKKEKRSLEGLERRVVSQDESLDTFKLATIVTEDKRAGKVRSKTYRNQRP